MRGTEGAVLNIAFYYSIDSVLFKANLVLNLSFIKAGKLHF